MVADQSLEALSTFGESFRLNVETIKEKMELQKQKEARKQNELSIKKTNLYGSILNIGIFIKHLKP